jgi:hypothetical protein
MLVNNVFEGALVVENTMINLQNIRKKYMSFKSTKWRTHKKIVYAHDMGALSFYEPLLPTFLANK